MSSIRWLGLIFGTCVLLYMFNRFRHGRARRMDFGLGVLFSLGLIIVSAYPNSVNTLRNMLSLAPTQFSRLIAICIVSNVLLWLVLFYTRFRLTDNTDQLDRLIRRLGVAEFERLYGDGAPLPPVVVVIPAYNEEDNIGPVLSEMPEQVCETPLGVIVIDDGSKDRTFEVVREAGVTAVQNPFRRGGGAALRTGFDIARKNGAQIVVTMDADGQHLPEEIERLVAPILADEVDFVIGSRILGEREKDSTFRYIGIHIFNALIRLLTVVKVTDCSNGFRAFRVKELSKILLRQDQFHTSELIIDASKKGIRIGEAPVTVKRRRSGVSKKGKDWSYGLKFARTIFKTWWR
ncbi:MAG: DUF2304 family protein [Deltaproteobacteria bacterium]|nr:DUF2304 family protein [Deltaproteobacteria bacterium]